MMVNRIQTALLLALFVALPVHAQPGALPAGMAPEGVARPDASGNPQFQNCVVELVDSIELPAPEAGVLVFQGIKPGAAVKAEDVIAKIDTRVQEKEARIAEIEFKAAMKRANDDIDIRYSAAAEDVAREGLKEILDARTRLEKAFSDFELRKAQLEYKRSGLGKEKAENDKELALWDAHVAKAKWEAAQLGIERRTIRAPFDGRVVEVFRKEQEWVSPGDSILRLIRLDTLRVGGMVPLAGFSPAEIDGCEVTFEFSGAKKRVEKATGRIVNINPEALQGTDSPLMRVTAEITNRTRQGHWVVWPKMNGKMTIHLGTGGVSVGDRSSGNQ